MIGVPLEEPAPRADAVVVALKSRTVPAADAVRESLAALRWLQRAGARQIYFKYCSTFDSTPHGNIGPVAEALMQALGADFTIACPAFPENGRTVFRGHLFVGDQLLSDSGMRDHPLTPMSDANLVRVLQAQSRGKVGLLRHDTVTKGATAIRERIAALRADGVRIAIADAIDDDDLRVLAAACVDLPLVTAGSGVALGLPAAYAAQGWVTPDAVAAGLPAVGGDAAVLSGSCSTATNAQVQQWLQAGRPGWRIDPLEVAAGEPVAQRAVGWARETLPREPVLVYATQTPQQVAAVQSALGAERAGQLVERCLADIAARAGRRRRASPRRGRRRNLRRRGAGARRAPAESRRADRPRRAMDARRRPAAAAGAEVRQLRRARLLRQGAGAGFMTQLDIDVMSVEICRVGRSLFERGYAHATAGNISVRLDHGVLITPTDACLGHLLPERLAFVDDAGEQRAGDRASKTLALHRRIYESDPAARCVIHTHSTHLVALTLAGVWSDADVLPPITPYYVMKVGHVPLIAYRRPGDAQAADAVARCDRRRARARRADTGGAARPARAGGLARVAGRGDGDARRAGRDRTAVADEPSRSRRR